MGCGEPLQLVEVKGGNLVVLEDSFQRSLMRKEIADLPVCVISIIGEQRRGKSFLLNYLLRRLEKLSKQDSADDSWTGKSDELLTGFSWCCGMERLTKGIWIWSEPFLLDRKTGDTRDKVAVFLVDTEGTLDVTTDKDTIVKISTISMLLSSFLILNTNKLVGETDMEYLELFLDHAKELTKTLEWQPMQHLDILVRDWYDASRCSTADGEEYLERIIQKIQTNSKFPDILETLKSSVSCHLLPSPGLQIPRSQQGTLKEMDPEFRDNLKLYVNFLHNSAGQYAKKYMTEHFVEKIKRVVEDLNERECYLGSPVQLRRTIKRLKKEREMDRILKEFREFLDEKVSSFGWFSLDLPRLEQDVRRECATLLERFTASLQGVEAREELQKELKIKLKEVAETFLEQVRGRFSNKIRAAINSSKEFLRGAMLRARRFLGKSVSSFGWFSLDLPRLEQDVRRECATLLERFTASLQGVEAREELQKELKIKLEEVVETFLEQVRGRFSNKIRAAINSSPEFLKGAMLRAWRFLGEPVWNSIQPLKIISQTIQWAPYAMYSLCALVLVIEMVSVFQPLVGLVIWLLVCVVGLAAGFFFHRNGK
ncbi:RING finger protein 112-like [Tachyglossus aculeatus]|uniref:RING finger protein 112-like n=1 Tax=Tachyglossus aculeatus TaxID=9261 RepID=UPI0018F2FD3A|nr:RING finger protein 112-like [Tachyglossus aculeatus]